MFDTPFNVLAGFRSRAQAETAARRLTSAGLPGASVEVGVRPDAGGPVETAELRAEMQKVAAASAEEVKRAAEEAVRKAALEGPAAVSAEDRITLELYLTQIPGCLRQSMKRADDPSGRSVPADFALNAPEDLARILPHRVPQFRPGAGARQRTRPRAARRGASRSS